MNSPNNFYAFRLTINQPDQLSVFATNKSKSDFINEVINALQTSIKLSFSSQSRRFLFYFRRRITEQIYLLQMAREDRIIQPQEGDQMVEDREMIIMPNVYFIIDIKTQIILIQNKKAVFERTTTPANRISEFFENQLSNYLVTVRLEPISKAEELWVEIEKAQGIYSLTLDINPPNFFGSRFKANIDIKEAHEETLFDKFILVLKNKLGRLKIERKDFQDVFQALASGAGEFAIDIKNKRGKLVRITNASRVRGIEFPPNLEQIDADKLQREIDELDKLNNNPDNKGENANESPNDNDKPADKKEEGDETSED